MFLLLLFYSQKFHQKQSQKGHNVLLKRKIGHAAADIQIFDILHKHTKATRWCKRALGTKGDKVCIVFLPHSEKANHKETGILKEHKGPV